MAESEARGHGGRDASYEDDYMMGRTESETRRLVRQSGFYGRFTWSLLTRAGIEPGMTVLDVGTGAGDVALLAADLVGPRGRVVGLDENPEVLETARERAREADLANVEFVEGDGRSLHDDGSFAAVVGRFVLMYQPEPSETLRALAGHVRPGGIVAFQEMNPFSDRGVSAAPTPLWDRAVGWLHRVIERAGIETEMGHKLYHAYLEAGLTAPTMESHAPVGGATDRRCHQYFVETLRSLMPLAEKFGIASAEEVEIDTLADRLSEEAEASGLVLKMPDAINAWARRP